MPTQVNRGVSPELQDALQELIGLNIDSRESYQETAEVISDTRLARLCWEIAMQRNAQARELQRLSLSLGITPRYSGTDGRVGQQGWRRAQTPRRTDPTALLAAASCAEGFLLKRYRHLIAQPYAAPVSDLLERHCVLLGDAQDRIREAAESYAEPPK